MLRLLELLLLTTLMLPPITGLVAVFAGFGDPWGMGSKSLWGIFLTAALPILPPGLYQMLALPLTFRVVLLLVPLAALARGGWYVLALLSYLAAVAAFWLVHATTAPEFLNVLIDGISYIPGRLNSDLWKFGIYLLTDSAVAAAVVSWWYWRK